MVLPSSARRAAAAAVPVGLLLPTALAVMLCRGPVTMAADHVAAGEPLTALPFEVAVTSVAALALAGSAAWLAVVVLAAVAETVTGRSCAALRGVSPVAVRNLVLGCSAVALGCSATLAPASAASDVTGGASEVDAPSGLVGLEVPDRPSGELRAVARAVARTPSPTVVTVRRGDSLWSITEELLPGPPADAGIAAAWPVLYRANHRTVGADPDIITPGMRLRVPSSLTSQAPAGDPSHPDREDRS